MHVETSLKNILFAAHVVEGIGLQADDGILQQLARLDELTQ